LRKVHNALDCCVISLPLKEKNAFTRLKVKRDEKKKLKSGPMAVNMSKVGVGHSGLLAAY
jgi:hypothetical protein